MPGAAPRMVDTFVIGEAQLESELSVPSRNLLP